MASFQQNSAIACKGIAFAVHSPYYIFYVVCMESQSIASADKVFIQMFALQLMTPFMQL